MPPEVDTDFAAEVAVLRVVAFFPGAAATVLFLVAAAGFALVAVPFPAPAVLAAAAVRADAVTRHPGPSPPANPNFPARSGKVHLNRGTALARS